MAIDLATGRELWSRPLPAALSGAGGGLLAVAGDTAVVVSPEKTFGLDLRAGTAKWTSPESSNCLIQQVAAAGRP